MKKSYDKLDSILKSRDITLLTKVHLVKAMVFPVVMYGCESWTIKKSEHQRIDAIELWCWRRLLRVLWTARRSNQSILKEISSEYSSEGLMLKLQYSGHLMWRTDSLEKTLMLGKIEGRRRRGWQRMRCLNAISDSMDMSLSKETWHAEVHRASKSQTWLSDWTVLNWTMKDDVLISIFSLLQKQLFREWGTWIYEVGFLISEKDLRRIYKWNFYCKCHDLKTTESFIIIHIPYHL